MGEARPDPPPNAAVTRLPALLVDQIAAGEVIERPAAAVKELVENAIDAGATRIVIALDEGGIDRIAVTDDGSGMGHADLRLAVERHCTSKLAHHDLGRIATLGFRGEALPSIGACARLTILSRSRDDRQAWRLTVEGGLIGGPTPAAGPQGTRVLVEDLFFATPARRKFLKSPRLEGDHAEAAIRRLALAHPGVGFTLTLDGRTVLERPVETRLARVTALLGHGAGCGLIEVTHSRDALVLEGYALGPSDSRSTTAHQFLVVNDRPVTDPVLRTAVRVAYRPVIAAGRHAAVALFLSVPTDQLDVNVHPAKTELRFRDPDGIRALVIGGLNRALGGGAGQARPAGFAPRAQVPRPPLAWSRPPATGFAERPLPLCLAPTARQSASDPSSPTDSPPVHDTPAPYPLGAPVAQILDTYILAVTADGSLVLVDQHAAHERLTHEALREQRQAGPIRAQALLVPDVIELPPAQIRQLLDRIETLARLGIEIEPFGPGAVLVRALPAILGQTASAPLLADMADELADCGESIALEARLDAALARLACHGSIRAGRRLGQVEMAALLRAMEATPRAATCSHGRPTFITLTRADLERMFGRT